ncbi:putative transcription factor B3-Domain family [Helianthus debilis subsp. tardiflorus]
MSFNNRGGGASFFKILLRDSIDRLPLPPAYARKYLETSSSSSSNMKKQMVVVLKIKSGVKWSVRYSKIRDKYYFMDGWLKFMKDNRLQMGVFLVFWRLSPSVFEVSVYGPNGCLKQPTVSHVSNRKTPFVNEEDVYDDDSSENVQQKKMISVVKRSYLHKMSSRDGTLGKNNRGWIHLALPVSKTYIPKNFYRMGGRKRIYPKVSIRILHI